MPYDISLPRSVDGYAAMRHCGDVDLAEIHTAATQILSHILARRCAGLLVDASQSVPVFSPAELIRVLDENYGPLPPGFPLAYVLNARNHATEQMLIETLAYNHGLALKVFTEVETALAWLECRMRVS